MRRKVLPQVLGSATADAQERLIDAVCGPRWAPTRTCQHRCPHCEATGDFARRLDFPPLIWLSQTARWRSPTLSSNCGPRSRSSAAGGTFPLVGWVKPSPPTAPTATPILPWALQMADDLTELLHVAVRTEQTTHDAFTVGCYHADQLLGATPPAPVSTLCAADSPTTRPGCRDPPGLPSAQPHPSTCKSSTLDDATAQDLSDLLSLTG